MNRRMFNAGLLYGWIAQEVLQGQQPEFVRPERKIDPFLVPPTEPSHITQGHIYNEEEWKFHRTYHIHYAIDFQRPRGSPVVAAADGVALASFHTVLLPPYVDDSGKTHKLGFGLGNFVQVWHPDQRVYTAYGHLDDVDKAVPYIEPKENGGFYSPEIVYQSLETVLAACKPIRQGQLIGHVGDTGLSMDFVDPEKPRTGRDFEKWPTWDPAGTHVHFEVYARLNGTKDRNQRWDPYAIYGEADAYASGKPAQSGNLWLLGADGKPKFAA